MSQSREPEQEHNAQERSADGAVDEQRSGFTRRSVLGGAIAGVAGAAAGFGGGWAAHAAQATPSSDDLNLEYPFYTTETRGHQAGIATPPQNYAMFTTYSMNDGMQRQQLQVLLARWSAAISLLQAGRPIGTVQPQNPNGVADDTGEATNLAPAGLTVTVGLGPSLFDDRFDLAAKRPALLKDLPTISGDNIDPAFHGGDLSLQVCANDPQVVYHAIRNLSRMARDTVTPKWSVTGFGRASAGPHQHTPRNLMGFKDGTRNANTDELLDKWVWLHQSDQPWMRGGTYQIVRKISMHIEIWDADYIGDQETVFGRTKYEGAPLTGKQEFDTPDFKKKSANGDHVIDPTAHIALAAHENNGGIQFLRRPYNYTDGMNAHGQLDAGLLFCCYTKDPNNFVTIQSKLGASDLLNEYISHIGSGIFAVPPAPRQGHYIGEQLFT